METRGSLMLDVLMGALLAIEVNGGSVRVLASYGMFRYPGLTCDCKVFAHRHETSWVMLTTGASMALVSLLILWGHDASPGEVGAAAINGVLAAWWLRDWWKHTRNTRKRLKDRVLGVVRATAAGLKIVPEPVGVQA
jgi:integral membrane sensor domain MASE1